MDPTLRNAGLAVLAVAGVVLGYVLITGKDDKGASCDLTAAGLGLLVTAVSEGKSAGQIAGLTVAGAVVPIACKEVVESVIDEPDDEVTVDVSGAGEETTTGTDLLDTQPPATPPAQTQRIIDCFRWGVPFLTRLCIDGGINPPAAPPPYTPLYGT